MFYTKNEKGRYQPVNDNMILDKAKDIIYARMVRENSSYGMSSPAHMVEFLKVALTDPYETFAMVYLDNRHRVIAFEKVFRGTIDGSSVHPREVVRECLNKNAAAVVFAHNHPSGVADPSQADIRITQKLKDALNLIEVRVLDHIIIGGDNYYSLAEHSML